MTGKIPFLFAFGIRLGLAVSESRSGKIATVCTSSTGTKLKLTIRTQKCGSERSCCLRCAHTKWIFPRLPSIWAPSKDRSTPKSLLWVFLKLNQSRVCQSPSQVESGQSKLQHVQMQAHARCTAIDWKSGRSRIWHKCCFWLVHTQIISIKEALEKNYFALQQRKPIGNPRTGSDNGTLALLVLI